MKTLRFSFVLLSEPEQFRRPSLFKAAEEALRRRTLSCSRDGENTLVASHVHEQWTKEKLERGGRCPENTFWNIQLDGFRFTNLTAAYENARLPCRDEHGSGFHWRNGESYWDLADVCGITVTCLPTPKTVTVSMDIKEGLDPDALHERRKAFLETQRIIERTIVQTRAAQRLVQTLKTDAGNGGRITRHENALFCALSLL
jgi:hypothetical protein